MLTCTIEMKKNKKWKKCDLKKSNIKNTETCSDPNGGLSHTDTG